MQMTTTKGERAQTLRWGSLSRDREGRERVMTSERINIAKESERGEHVNQFSSPWQGQSRRERERELFSWSDEALR